MFTRERHRKTVQYFGPYSSAKKVRETLDVLNRVFPYRPCEGPTPGRRSGVPCLDYHIGRCAAPCVGYISAEEYRAVIDSVVEFLSGRVRPLERRLEKAMKDASAAHEFEDAARYRNRLMAVRHLSERQVADRRSMGSADILGVACGERHRQRPALPPARRTALRPARLLPRERRRPQRVRRAVGLRARVLRRPGRDPRPGRRPARRSRTPTCSSSSCPTGAARAVEVRSAQRGEKRRLADMAARNARAGARARHDPARAHARPPDRGARGAARAAQPRVAADADRVLRRLEPGRDESGRVDGRVRGRRREEVRLPQVRDPLPRARTTSR